MYVASQIFDGQGTSSPSLGQFCGSQLPSSIPSSSSRYVTVQFMSNADGRTSSGFRLDFAPKGERYNVEFNGGVSKVSGCSSS